MNKADSIITEVVSESETSLNMAWNNLNRIVMYGVRKTVERKLELDALNRALTSFISGYGHDNDFQLAISGSLLFEDPYTTGISFDDLLECLACRNFVTHSPTYWNVHELLKGQQLTKIDQSPIPTVWFYSHKLTKIVDKWLTSIHIEHEVVHQ